MLGTCTLTCFIAEILITVQYPPTLLLQLQWPLKKSLNLYPQVTIYNYRYGDSITYIIMVQPYINFTDSDASGTAYE